jgi:hypothetical protein
MRSRLKMRYISCGVIVLALLGSAMAIAATEFSGGQCIEEGNCGNCRAGVSVKRADGTYECYVMKGSTTSSVGKTCVDSSSSSNRCNPVGEPGTETCTVDTWDCGLRNGDGDCGIVNCACSGTPEWEGQSLKDAVGDCTS